MIHRSAAAALRSSIIAAALGALAACSGVGGYPSLAPRAIERPAGMAAETITAPPAPADAALDARVAALAAQAAAGDAAFRAAADEGCAAVARGTRAAAGSEPWIAAQQALSGLEAARAPVLAAATELDRLVIDQGTAEGPAVDIGRLAAAQAEVSALDAAEQARLGELSAGRCGAE